MTTELLICTDLDRTLIPNGPEPESADARAHFSTLVEQPGITLGYVSGRDLKLVEDAIHLYHLPIPDYIIADVGTTIYQQDTQAQWTPLDEWAQHIGNDWQGKSQHELAQLLSGIGELRLQEASKQNRFKLSYYLSLNANREQLTEKIQKKLAGINVRARLIWSIDEPAGIGLLDILPVSASKLHAIEALMQRLGASTQNTIFSGDSGNDLEVLVSPIPSVLVANSQPEVQHLAVNQSRTQGNQHSLYLASGQLAEMNGNYSAGILEGIAHFYPHILRPLGLCLTTKTT